MSGGDPGPHKIQGIGAGFIPQILNFKTIDEISQVKDDGAFQTSRELARMEGPLVGISSGAAAFVALKISHRAEFKNKNIIFFLPDTGERYLSTVLYQFE